MDDRTALRTVQARFATSDPELPNGFAEHTTMGAEAMLVLGLDTGSVLAWAARHDPVEIDGDGQIAARRSEILRELDVLDWTEVLQPHVEQLAPHVGAHLFHGLIRTAHAVRALGAGDDDVARAELATGLAAWHVWADRGGDEAPPSTDRANGDPAALVLEAARRGAGACAQRPSIVAIHAVTGPMAFLLLAGIVDEATLHCAALAFERTHARYGDTAMSTTSVRPGSADLADLAGHWDAHPAKLVEAALRGHDATGDGVFLDAAAAIMRA